MKKLQAVLKTVQEKTRPLIFSAIFPLRFHPQDGSNQKWDVPNLGTLNGEFSPKRAKHFFGCLGPKISIAPALEVKIHPKRTLTNRAGAVINGHALLTGLPG